MFNEFNNRIQETRAAHSGSMDLTQMEKKDRISKISITLGTSIMESLKQMEKLAVRLLLVMAGEKFRGVLSIGDIQRAIIKNVDLETPIQKILRKEINVASPEDDLDKVMEWMLVNKAECMPVINNDSMLVDVLFWDELFKDGAKPYSTLNLPVVVMAGGKGTRLEPLTHILPKPLIPVGKKTIIEHIMDRFLSAGCNEFYISLNHKAEMIRHYFDTMENPGFNITCFEEETPLGTAGSLYLLKNQIQQTFFLVNCDILVDEDYGNILNYHLVNKNLITIVAALKHVRIPYGIIKTREDGILTALDEKPELMFKINSGMYILEPQLLSLIPENTFFHITDLIEQVKLKGGRIGVFPISETAWKDIGEWDKYLVNKDLDFP